MCPGFCLDGLQYIKRTPVWMVYFDYGETHTNVIAKTNRIDPMTHPPKLPDQHSLFYTHI